MFPSLDKKLGLKMIMKGFAQCYFLLDPFSKQHNQLLALNQVELKLILINFYSSLQVSQRTLIMVLCYQVSYISLKLSMETIKN